MAQRDYILREIERLGEFLAALRRRLLGGQGENDLAAVRGDLDAFGQRAGLNPMLLRSLTAETLSLTIGGRAGNDPATCWLWAEFLFVDGLTARAEGHEDDAHDRLVKALMLYRLLNAPFAHVWPDDITSRIADIETMLHD